MPLAPYLNFAPLDNALVALENGAKAFASASSKLSGLPADKLKELNEIVFKIERKLILAAGLPAGPGSVIRFILPVFKQGMA